MTKSDTVAVGYFFCYECGNFEVFEEILPAYGVEVPKELYDRYVVAVKNLAPILDEIRQHIKE